MPLDDRTLEKLRERLVARQNALQSEVRDGVATRESEDDYRRMAGEVGDPGDASVATEQVDLRNAQINRDLGELHP